MSSCCISEQQKAKNDKNWKKMVLFLYFAAVVRPYHHIKLYVARWDEVIVSVCASECYILWKSWLQKYWCFNHWLRADKGTNDNWFLFLQIQTNAWEPILVLTEVSATSLYGKSFMVPSTPSHAFLLWDVAIQSEFRNKSHDIKNVLLFCFFQTKFY